MKVDRTQPKPKVSIIGEFWAMTTEGDGNYQLQRFLEGEGAEADIQLVTAWLLYMLWEAEHDTNERKDLRGEDKAKYGLGGMGAFGVAKKLVGVAAAEQIVRGLFQTFAHAMGLYGYHLPDMNEIAKISHEYYNNDLRGGEGHMEVGKLIMNVVHSQGAHDAQREAVRLHAERGRLRRRAVGHHREVPRHDLLPGRDERRRPRELLLARADVPLQGEAGRRRGVRARAAQEHGVTREQVRAFLEATPRFASSLHKAPHAYAGNGADLVAEVAPYITKSRGERWRGRLAKLAQQSGETARKSPHMVVELFRSAVEKAPEVAARVKEDVTMYREVRRAKKGEATRAMEAAAE